MKNKFELKVEIREITKKRHNGRLRNKHSIIPAVIYGAKQESISIQLKQNDLMFALSNKDFYKDEVTILLADKEYKTKLHDVQWHPYKNKVLHVDFLRIS